MQLVERHIIKKSHKHWKEIDQLCFKAKNLFNASNYICRQYFFESGKQYNLNELYHLTKNLVDYKALPTKVSKQIIKRLAEDWKSYFKALREWKKNPGKFLGKPNIPRYKDKEKGRSVAIYPDESVYKPELKQGICYLSMSSIKIPTKVTRESLAQVRLVPQTNCYVIEIVYEKECEPPEPQNPLKYVAGIDLGLNNLIALTAFSTSNQPGFTPLLVNGRPLKSVNQFYNKIKSKLQSLLPKSQKRKVTRKILALTAYRNNYIESYMHQTSRLIVNLLKAKGIKTLVIGKNDGWKQKINIGRKNNQAFTHLPHNKLISQLEYKCELAGIKVILTEESYTSMTSALDLELPTKQETYCGKRIKRGLFRSASGKLINADVNGSIQIIRKAQMNGHLQAFPDLFNSDGIESLAAKPQRIDPYPYPFKEKK